MFNYRILAFFALLLSGTIAKPMQEFRTKRPKNCLILLGKKQRRRFKELKKIQRVGIKDTTMLPEQKNPISCPPAVQRSLFYLGLVAFTATYYYIYNNAILY